MNGRDRTLGDVTGEADSLQSMLLDGSLTGERVAVAAGAMLALAWVLGEPGCRAPSLLSVDAERAAAGA